MTKNTLFLILTTAFILLLNGGVFGQMVLRVDDIGFACTGDTNRSLTISLENDGNVAAIQFDMIFDPDCFTIDPASLTRTDRSADLHIFQASNPDPGVVKFAGTGIGTFIAPGSGSIAEFTLDITWNCAEGEYYPLTLFNTKLANSSGMEYTHSVENGYIDIFCCDPMLEISSAEFDLGDIWIGSVGIDTLIICNVGTRSANVHIFSENCASAYPNIFELNVGQSRDVIVSCHPEKPGPCEGILEVSGGGWVEVPVTCNGVIPARSKGDINGDGVIDVLDIVEAVHIFLGIYNPSSEESQAADCNGPTYKCDGDGVVDVLDIMKIVNLILRMDECLPSNIVYFNSFESDEDTTGWRWIFQEMFVADPAPGCGRQSLFIGGGCTQPAAYIELPSQAEDSYYIVSCWGKANESDRGGKIVLTTGDVGEERDETELIIHGTEWVSYASEESLYCPADNTLRIELWIGGFVPAYMFVDCIKVEKVE
ncbi:MAG: hypothetical protein JSV84_12600 [Gemmatimonadota bacterium]|nr:MAG: hypothetical protein JSV84_12600 [Gemmatimonadota bacterium]